MFALSTKQLPLILSIISSVFLGNAEASNSTSYSAVFAFGDSILDTGNNNNLRTMSKCNFPPYGKDLTGSGGPSGRFCNGKVPSDLIAEAVGVKDLLPPYLNPGLSSDDLATGVCFASGGSGLDPITSSIQGVVSVSNQLDLFKEYVGKLKQAVGEDRANSILNSSLYVVSAGNNDIAITYFSSRLRPNYLFPAYAGLLVMSSADFAKELHSLGARKIAFLSTLPLGCLPSARSMSGLLRICSDFVNEAAQLFNSKLSSAVDSLNKELTDASFVYVDVYGALLNIIQNPWNFGFEVADRGCCTGQMGVFCTPTSITCTDASKYVFWDGAHPTESAYKVLAPEIVRAIQEHSIK